jgi:hypothetical protein
MSRWKLRDKHGWFRSCKSFKQDLAQDSDEPWEVARLKKKGGLKMPKWKSII